MVKNSVPCIFTHGVSVWNYQRLSGPACWLMATRWSRHAWRSLEMCVRHLDLEHMVTFWWASWHNTLVKIQPELALHLTVTVQMTQSSDQSEWAKNWFAKPSMVMRSHFSDLQVSRQRQSYRKAEIFWKDWNWWHACDAAECCNAARQKTQKKHSH